MLSIVLMSSGRKLNCNFTRSLLHFWENIFFQKRWCSIRLLFLSFTLKCDVVRGYCIFPELLYHHCYKLDEIWFGCDRLCRKNVMDFYILKWRKLLSIDISEKRKVKTRTIWIDNLRSLAVNYLLYFKLFRFTNQMLPIYEESLKSA